MSSIDSRRAGQRESGAGHGFLRQQEGSDGANLAASLKAWPATAQFLRERLE